jgi:glycosyltransferase involved in cell wall biosynthesis
MSSIARAACTKPAPSVSVVIPTFNRARDIPRCLDSLAAQTYKHFEVLVCDDGSTDDTRAVVARYVDKLPIEYHWAENFGGAARPRNAGMRLARGKYIAFLDSDDWWRPEKLARCVERLEAGADLVYHDLFVIRSAGQRFSWRKVRTAELVPPLFDDLVRKGNVVPNSSVVVRASTIRDIGGFSENEGLIAWEDYDAWLRIAKLTERFERIDETLGYYWLGSNNISSPRRTIDNLERFKETYLADERKVPAWYHYAMGLSYHKLARHELALEHLRHAVMLGLPAANSLKALVKIAMSGGRVLAGRVAGMNAS